MKRIMAFVLTVLMVMGLCVRVNEAQAAGLPFLGIPSGEQTTASDATATDEPKYYVILNNDGEKREIKYLLDMATQNELKWDKFISDGGYIEIVAPIWEIGGQSTYTYFTPYRDVTSSIRLYDMNLTIDTSGFEDIIADCEVGDLLKVKCKITDRRNNLIFSFQTSDNKIEIEKYDENSVNAQANTEVTVAEPKCYVILNNDGEKREIKYLLDMATQNELKWDKFISDGGYIEIVAPIWKIGGKSTYTTFKPYRDVTSSISLYDMNLTIDTSGFEDIIADCEVGDLLKVKCKITDRRNNLIYSFQPNNKIEIEAVK